MRDLIMKCYALEQAGLSCIEELEKAVADMLNITPEVLKQEYYNITTKINENNRGLTNEQFQKLIYAEYMDYFKNVPAADYNPKLFEQYLMDSDDPYAILLLLEEKLQEMEESIDE